ncbi:MAG: LamG domain-containing protein [Acidobacteria bacterium]|nr:LamG domain-containing protein [Acidobacteriota bacterium]
MFQKLTSAAVRWALAAAFATAALADTNVCVQPPSGMVAWLGGDNTAADQLGANNGTFLNGPAYAAGRVATAFNFNGTDQFVSIPDSPSLSVTGSFSLDAWIYVRAYSIEFTPVAAKWNDLGVNQRSYMLAVMPFGALRFDVSRAGFFGGGGFLSGPNQFAGPENAVVVSANGAVPLNTWTHVAATYDAPSGLVSVYINGTLRNSIVAPFHAVFDNTQPMLIGASDSGSNVRDYFNGLIDEVEVFNRVLTAGEIQGIVSSANAGKCKLNVTIDIKPCSFPNAINLNSQGVIPVAILGSTTLDVTDIDVSTVMLEGMGVNSPGKSGKLQCSIQDLTGPAFVTADSCSADGLPDLVCHVQTQSVQLADPSMMRLTALTKGGISLSGFDSVKIVP